mgnify:CR=1 FL=1
MNKLFRTKFIAEAIDVEHFWVNCPIPSYMCCERSHKYKSKIYDKKLFKKSLKKYRENQDLGKTQNYI